MAPDPHPADRMKLTTTRFLLLAALLAVMASLLLSLGLGGGFVLDDVHTIVRNTLIQVNDFGTEEFWLAVSSFHVGGGSRPLAMASFALDFWRHGSLDASTFKATNLLIHALTTFGLALMVRKLLLLARWPPQRAGATALLIALVWAIHPLQVSSVLYAVQRMQTLVTLFLVWALWAYLVLRQKQMQGRPGWPYGLLAVGFWVLALASKEDAALLPAYCLLLELTVLRFAAADPIRERGLRRTYFGLCGLGIAAFLFWVVPHYWSWGAYPGREFNSIERLLTQGRVLVMYLGQIVLPLPSRMPFNYDDLVISRSLLSPWTTLPALLVVLGLLAWAWRWRLRRPVFAFGVLLFFAGHFISSNIVGLELAFEHRNHLPLIGAVLALGDLFIAAWQRWRIPPRWVATLTALIVIVLGSAGALRAYMWGEPVRFAKYNVEIAPHSPRAWLALGGVYYDLSNRDRNNPNLDLAIDAVERGAAMTQSASAYANIVIYKTIKGSITTADWDHLLQRLEEVPMLPPNKNILWTTIGNFRAGVGLDEDQVLRLIEVITRRARLQPRDYLQVGVFIYKNTQHPDMALPQFLRAAEGLSADNREIVGLRAELVKQGRADWADQIGAVHAHPGNEPH